jgi:hypothetical protein
VAGTVKVQGPSVSDPPVRVVSEPLQAGLGVKVGLNVGVEVEVKVGV